MSHRKRPRPPQTEQLVVYRLRELEQEREAYRALTRRLVHAAFERFPLPSAGPIVEIGAGLGELYGLLPEAIRARWVLTEPTELGVRELLRRYPAARVVRAEVEHLPFADAEVAGIVGLCVLDLLPDLLQARAEIERVLCDRGLLLHALDQNPHLARIFERLAPLGLVVLPNVFGDPNQSHFPEDLLLIEAEQLALVTQILSRHGQAQGQPLARYLALFAAKPFPLSRALAEFDHLASDDQRRTLVRRAFEQAPRVATAEERALLGDLRGHLISSSQDLTGRFERELVSSELQLVYNNLSFACEVVEATGSAAYRSLCVGQHRSLSVAPERPLVAGAPQAPSGGQLSELGIHVFAARRTARVVSDSKAAPASESRAPTQRYGQQTEHA